MRTMIFVAEIGMNHDGNFDLAYELIRQAKLAGADKVKFQFGWRDQPGEINCIDLERARRLQAWCDDFGIDMFASIISESAFDIARSIGLKQYKIASRTVLDKPDLCRRILNAAEATYVSLGMWSGPGYPFGPPDGERLKYLFCRFRYPAYPEDLKGFPERFHPQSYYGYSDHCHGIAACLLAIARGARYIEKHFTLNKSSQVIRDHVMSATPDEFRTLVEQGREIGRLVNRIGRG